MDRNGDAARRRSRLLDGDYRAMLAASDARKRDLAAQREAAMNNEELRAHLLANAQRRGLSEIDWSEYFRNAYMV